MPIAAPLALCLATERDAVPTRSTRMTSVMASGARLPAPSRNVRLLAATKLPVTTVPSIVRTFSGVPGSSIITLSQRPTGETSAGRLYRWLVCLERADMAAML